MGIRIQKQLGFIAIGPHFNDVELLSEMTLRKALKTIPASDAAHFMKDWNDKKINLNQKVENFITILDCPNDESKSIFIFTPPNTYEKTWSRSSDLIDYYEHQKNYGIDATTTIHYIHETLLPYGEPMIVSSTGKEISSDNEQRLSILNPDWFEKNEDIKSNLQKAGLNFLLPLKPQIHMRAPAAIMAFAKLVGFNDIKDLKLGIVTHWG